MYSKRFCVNSETKWKRESRATGNIELSDAADAEEYAAAAAAAIAAFGAVAAEMPHATYTCETGFTMETPPPADELVV
jgi:ribosomal protein L21E